MRIALFITCLADALYPDVGKATVRLLERLGHEVAFPQAQTCCGQMHINTGYQPEALPLVRHFVETFEPYEAIVAPSGSCVGSVRHQHAMVARGQGDEGLARTCAENGWYCSFAGPLTFVANDDLRAALRVLPAGLVLVETDAPYLTPAPDRGRPNAPYLLPTTVRRVAQVRDEPLEQVCAQVSATAEAVYGPW